MRPKRALFAGEIVAEFLPPMRPSSRVVILCDGLPSMPSKHRLLQWFSKKGFWAFHLRYRGTWESGGRFLDHDPAQDVLDLIDAIKEGFQTVWGEEDFHIDPKAKPSLANARSTSADSDRQSVGTDGELGSVAVIGASFGGSVALMAGLDQRVHKVVAIAPVIDWTVEGDEPMEWLKHVIQDGYGGCYRFEQTDWERLEKGKLVQPIAKLSAFDPQKNFIIHAKDDTVVPIGSLELFLNTQDCKHKILRKGGHLSLSAMMRWPLSWSVSKFLKS